MVLVPWWFMVAVALILLLFGVFVGYAIAAYEDLRRAEASLKSMEED